MFDILTLIPGKRKRTSSGWYTFNSVCCHHRGHRPDKKGRGGIIFENEVNWNYHCFNCDFTCGFVLGKSLSRNLRLMLSWVGIDQSQINKWSLESLQQKDLIEIYLERRKKLTVNFKETSLPPNAILIDGSNIDHKNYVTYIESRGLSLSDYPFMITPNENGRNKNRIIIPYTFQNKIVGHISRYIDDREPKYVKDQQQGYVFGYDLQKPDYEVCVVVEGIFDALSIGGCALTHDNISDEQAELLRKLNRRIIVVPDLDKTGLTVIDRALELGFEVSIPDWHHSVKDTNDAVKRYGKLPTLLSILKNYSKSKIKVELKRKKVAKRI
jgi:hypothetical protein